RLRKRSEALASGTSQPLEENSHLIAPQQRTLTLSSGRVITLKLHIFIGKEEIEKFTRIDSSNIREQSWLNEKSLSDILPTIAAMQLYPAIGYSDTDNHILIVDGSRR
ncbi:plasmid partitioning protein B, partial [Shewanella xiamenensis]|nr:plasmid partitioning protein B [Shewanella xiamenensis]